MKKTNSLLFCFDNISQFSYFKAAIISLPKENFLNFDISLMISIEVSQNNDFKKFITDFNETNFNIHVVKENVPGMFYWILSSHIFNYEKIIQIDVDVLFGPKTNFNNLIIETKNNLKPIMGIQVNANDSKKAKAFANTFPRNEQIKILKRNYINSGVVIIDVEAFKKINSFENLESTIKNVFSFLEYCSKNNINKFDQEFILNYLYKEIGFINKKWNIRFFSKKDIQNFLNNDEDEYVLHFCIRILNFKNFKYQKINYLKYFNKSLEKKKPIYFSRRNKFYLKICKPSFWFPFKKINKIGKNQIKIYSKIELASKKIIVNVLSNINNIRRLNFNEFQKELMASFEKINERFKKNDIFWWANSGTLLGAVRNKNIISWDDDIDMSMFNIDFFANKQKINTILEKLDWELADSTLNKGQDVMRFFSKEKIIVNYKGDEYLTKFYIDIMIAVPSRGSSKIKSNWWTVVNNYSWIYGNFYNILPKFGWIKGEKVKIGNLRNFLVFFSKVITFPFMFWIPIYQTKKIKKISNNSNKYQLFYSYNNKLIIYKYKEKENNFTTLAFGNSEINVPKNFNKELEIWFGKNWMKLPPEKNRVPHNLLLTPNNGTNYKINPFLIK